MKTRKERNWLTSKRKIGGRGRGTGKEENKDGDGDDESIGEAF